MEPIREEYLDQKKTLEYLAKKGINRSPFWLERGRWAGTGPRFCKIAGRPYSKPEWVDEYLLNCEKGGKR